MAWDVFNSGSCSSYNMRTCLFSLQSDTPSTTTWSAKIWKWNCTIIKGILDMKLQKFGSTFDMQACHILFKEPSIYINSTCHKDLLRQELSLPHFTDGDTDTKEVKQLVTNHTHLMSCGVRIWTPKDNSKSVLHSFLGLLASDFLVVKLRTELELVIQA